MSVDKLASLEPYTISSPYFLCLEPHTHTFLELFMLNPGQFFPPDEVLERVWGADYVPQSNIVAVHIKNIRDKVGKKIIEMVRGYGYRFGD